VIGRRVLGLDWYNWEPGDYGFSFEDGYWVGVTPNDLSANLSRHEVQEHEDGTITVAPSIECWARRTKELARAEGAYWHGYLEQGVWREC
jgi:hypothetical protein